MTMSNRGFTLFIAIVVMGTLLLVATSLVNLSVRQARIASSGSSSQHAFYAADTGMECALYWDVKNPAGYSAFSTTTSSIINCNGLNRNAGGASPSQFSLTFLPNPFCATVTVSKTYVGSTLVTTIESKGYNTCDTASPRRVERAVRASY